MLTLVPTPIGNLEDITLRALRVLKEVDLIACEDTRTSGVLLSHYDIRTATTSYHAHNEHKKTPQLIERMKAGQRLALITDAGTPGISDPGFYLTRACVRNDVPVEALPGASAVLPALTVSGLPCDRFVFEGFLPQKKGRQTRIRELSTDPRTLVLYESPYRIAKTLGQLADVFGTERPAAVARELSKKFEEVRRGTLATLQAHYDAQNRVRGEIVLVVGGHDA
ncbi:MAG: 16S rRNA (cytidine(1402)-2'-O)-methyltransferase [Bacteroidetes bacterium]|jgi:16S rRNA (cytidine1402-2'-O)-methyltransferase|nr:16S rRNA (cytidine(1402)-2'-O)-methyltransferase [Bacteroidota bacterium]